MSKRVSRPSRVPLPIQDTTDDLVFATKKLGLGLTKFGKRIKEDLVGAPSGSAAETLAYNTAQSASSASQARRDRGREDDGGDDDHGGGVYGGTGGGGGSMHRSGSGGGLSGALAGQVGGGAHRRDLPPELDSLRGMIDAFVDGSKYWLAMQEALQQLVEAQAAVASAQAQVGELLSAAKVADATSQSSSVLAPGAFGSAHAKAASARASAAKEMRLWVLEPLGAHVGAACVDASVDVKEYESGLDDLALQHAHVQKLAAKGPRKAGETAAATAKLEQMQRRLEPLAQRVRSKLELLLEKQDVDAEKWVAKHASCERRLAQELTSAFSATLAFEARAKGVPRPKVEEPEAEAEEEEAPPSKGRGWLFGSSSGGGAEDGKKSGKKKAAKKDKAGREEEDGEEAAVALPQSKPGVSVRSGGNAARTAAEPAERPTSSMRRTASEPSGAVDLLPAASKSMRGRLGMGAAPPADPPPAAAASSSSRSRQAAAVVDTEDDDAAAEAAAKAARKVARKAEKERAAAAAVPPSGGGSSAYGGASSRDKGASGKERERERHAAQEEEAVTVSVFAKKKKAQLPEEPPPPVAEKSRSKRAGW